MSSSQDFEGSLIDWTSPVVKRNLSQPLIPLPVFTSPHSEITGDNPFDALERQVNDGILDLLNPSSSLLDHVQSSPASNRRLASAHVTKFGNLVQLDENDPNDFELAHLIKVVDSPIQESSFLHDLVVSPISGCSDDLLNKAFHVSRTSHYSNLWSSDDWTTSLTNFERIGELDKCLLVDMDYEDLMSVTMPTWCDELLSSSDDDEFNAYKFSHSLPIGLRKDLPKTPESLQTQLNHEPSSLKMNAKDHNSHKSPRTTKSKQKNSTLVTSTPVIDETRRTSRIGSRVSQKRKETVTRAPSPDSTSNLPAPPPHKIASKNQRVSKLTGKTGRPKGRVRFQLNKK